MKILVTILALLISASALSHEGFKARDRYTDEHGVPYGAQNPPVYAGNVGAHCTYSAYGCSGAGGSTDPRGYSYRYPLSNPYMYNPYGGYGYGGYGHSGGCGSTSTTTGGGVSTGNGYTSGGASIQQSRVVCTPNGVAHQSRGGSIGITNGNIGGSMNFGNTVITTP